MWSYKQSTGEIWSPDHLLLAKGYSGAPGAVNDPSKEAVHDVGPIPRGLWSIGEAFNDTHLGRIVLPLSPAPGTNTFGRSGFLIHADSMARPGTASRGCIIMPSFVRALIGQSHDKELEVN